MEIWENPFVMLRLPKLFNLRSDPFETADHEGMDYKRWRLEHLFLLLLGAAVRRPVPGHVQGILAGAATGSFGIDQVLRQVTPSAFDFVTSFGVGHDPVN
jgi:arylsulfatase